MTVKELIEKLQKCDPEALCMKEVFQDEYMVMDWPYQETVEVDEVGQYTRYCKFAEPTGLKKLKAVVFE